MSEQRKFERVSFPYRIVLARGRERFTGRLENISTNGALVDLDCELDLQTGERLLLTVEADPGKPPLELEAEAIHASSTLVGMRFTGCRGETGPRLERLVERMSSDPERLDDYLDRIRSYLSEYRSAI